MAEGKVDAYRAVSSALNPGAWVHRSEQQHSGVGQGPFKLVEDEEKAGTASFSLSYPYQVQHLAQSHCSITVTLSGQCLDLLDGFSFPVPSLPLLHTAPWELRNCYPRHEGLGPHRRGWTSAAAGVSPSGSPRIAWCLLRAVSQVASTASSRYLNPWKEKGFLLSP